MKTILILLDGIGDRSYKELNGLTPLQSAATPNLDHLACLGSNGLFHASSPGQCLPSETAHYFLFGYNLKNFPGRGLLEAVGEGVTFDDEDVLCLAHLAGVSWQAGVPVLACGRDNIRGDTKEIGLMFASITPFESRGISFRLQQTRRNDAILVLSGGASPYISDSDPMLKGQTIASIRPFADSPEPEQAKRTARALNDYLAYCHQTLCDHEVNTRRNDGNITPPNFLVTQRCGRRIKQEPFDQLWGLTGAIIASGAIYKGLAHELGFGFFPVKDSGKPGEDLRERIRAALADTTYDFIHVHTKVPDEAAHTGDPKQKEAVISALDQGLDELIKAVKTRDDLLVVVTADHSTPCGSNLIHSGESVPLTFVGPTIRRDGVNSFDEVSAAYGCLGILRGRELMLMILNYSDRSALLGHRLGKTERPYFPSNYEPFRLIQQET